MLLSTAFIARRHSALIILSARHPNEEVLLFVPEERSVDVVGTDVLLFVPEERSVDVVGTVTDVV